MDNLDARYLKILEILKKVEEKSNFSIKKRKPKLSDIEIIALSLAAESCGLDSENHLFRNLPKSVVGKIERSVFNRRRRALFVVYEAVRKKICQKILFKNDKFIVDSMPVEICKLVRAKRSKICRETPETSPNLGYCASQNRYYFGYKLHAVCTTDGVFTSFDLTAASVHDVNYLKDIKLGYKNCTFIGDKGYIGKKHQLDLFTHCNVKLEIPCRKNQLVENKPNTFFRIKRKRIETLFSQLCDQFMIRRNYAKIFAGFKTRIISKLLAITCLQFINLLLGRKLNALKSLSFGK